MAHSYLEDPMHRSPAWNAGCKVGPRRSLDELPELCPIFLVESDAKESDGYEAEQVQRRAVYRDSEGARVRDGDGGRLPPTWDPLSYILQVEVEVDGLEVSEACRLRTLEDEGARLKKLLAEAVLDNVVLKISHQKMVTPGSRREAVAHSREHHGLSQRRACKLIGVIRRVIRYRSSRPDDDPLRQRLRELAAKHRRFGYRRLGNLLASEGM